MNLSLPLVFRPAQLSRRGEATAWVLALVCGGTLAALIVFQRDVPVAAFGITLLFLLAAASISLGNWMDRCTELRLDEDGLHFRNGLRNVRLGWDEIRQIQVWPGGLGDRVRVIGDESHFYFRIGREVRYQGRIRGRVGFEDGEQMLEILLARSGLKLEGPAAGEYSSLG